MQSPSKQTNGNGRAGQGRGKYGRGEEALALTLRYVNADSFGGKGFCGFMSGCVVSSFFCLVLPGGLLACLLVL